MKHLLLTLAALAFLRPGPLQAQELDLDSETHIYFIVDEMPIFGHCSTDLADYLRQNLRYPAEAEAQHLEGRVYVRFAILPDGSVGHASVHRPAGCEALNQEALRVVAQMPRWQAGKMQGEPVPVWHVLPVCFDLDQCERLGSPRGPGSQAADLPRE